MPGLHTREQIWARDAQGLKHAITVVRARIPGSPQVLAPPRTRWRVETAAGRLDARAAEAVLGAAGVVALPRRRRDPSGLTEREIEVVPAGGR